MTGEGQIKEETEEEILSVTCGEEEGIEGVGRKKESGEEGESGEGGRWESGKWKVGKVLVI
jgi:hypothetical protein